jgi:DNA-binding IclR family transcriptional regulator
MRRITRLAPEPSAAGRRRAAVRAAAEHHYTAERVLQALEVIVRRPSSAPAVAEAIGVHPRTARRILRSLARQQYVEQRAGGGRARDYQPTVRLLAMAAQLAPRLPLIQRGRRAIHEIERQTHLTAYLAVPCYEDVLVIACSGERGVRPWALLPAASDAAGRVLLAHREGWRQSLAGATPRLAMGEREAAAIIERGHVVVAAMDDGLGSLAVAVADRTVPLAALAFRGPTADLLANEDALAELLTRAAAEPAEAEGSRRAA